MRNECDRTPIQKSWCFQPRKAAKVREHSLCVRNIPGSQARSGWGDVSRRVR